MGKFAGLALVTVMATSMMAQASGGKKHGSKLERWDAVQALRPGTEIDVLAGSQGVEECLVSAVDNSALTCLREDPTKDTRLVFPREGVREVRIWEAAPNRHIGLWIGMGVGFALGGWVCAEAGPRAIIFCGILGASLVMAAILGEPPARIGWYPRWPPPVGSQRPPRMRWRLVYRGATP